jgi:hypothetical protein
MKNVVCILLCCLFIECCSTSTGSDNFPTTKDYFEIYSMNMDGTGSMQLTNEKMNTAFFEYLPKSDKILFVQGDEIFLENSDGSQRRLLSQGNIFLSPIYSKSLIVTQDEQTAFFLKFPSGFPDNFILYSLSISTGEVKQIVQDSGWIGMESVGASSDGSQIIYNVIRPEPKPSTLYLINTSTLEKRKVKEGINLYCFYPQFVPNSSHALFFERIDTITTNSYLRLVDLNDTSKTSILDTVSTYDSVYPAINPTGEIFYYKNGITVLNINSFERKTISYTLYLNSIYDYINWSYDETRLIFTDNLNNRIEVYNLLNDSLASVKPNQAGQQGTAYYPFNFPYLNYTNSKIFYTVRFTETTYI